MQTNIFSGDLRCGQWVHLFHNGFLRNIYRFCLRRYNDGMGYIEGRPRGCKDGFHIRSNVQTFSFSLIFSMKAFENIS